MRSASASAAEIRRDISRRNLDRARHHPHEQTYGATPSVIYGEDQGAHGNFIPASYRAISARPEWRRRLDKSYTGSKWVPRSGDRSRCELDCANSSDALLMNIFCYPRVLNRPALRGLLGIDGEPQQERLQPEFGHRPRIPFLNGAADRTEVDMRLGSVLVEAKLLETGIPSAPVRLLSRYRDLHEVFDLAELPITGGDPQRGTETKRIHGYQLVRGALAAYATGSSFILLCDGRRTDLIEGWLMVLRAVRSYSFRSRLKLLTWQEMAAALPRSLRLFLEEKYGIAPSRTGP